jgi:porin
VSLLAANSVVLAGAKDESAADWLPLLPPPLKEWRSMLADKGLTFGATYIVDNIGNVTGGFRRGAINFGRLDLDVDADLEKLVGWSGATFHANMFEIYGWGLTRSDIGNLATISEIEALPDTRLYEAWIEQSFWAGTVLLRVGQQAADVDFFDSETDDLFINGTFGWPAIMAFALPAGGPAPPIAVPGVRVKAKLSDEWTAFAAIFDGNPAGNGEGEPQWLDFHGLAFRVTDSPWLIGQVRYDYNLIVGGRNLRGNITPGAWYHTGVFDDQRFTADGLSLADPAGSGIPAKRRGNYSVFGVLEQTLYRPEGVNDKEVSASLPGITMFARAAYCPPDRNLIDFYADGGIGVSGLVPGRPHDRFGVAVAYMHISPVAQQLDRDYQFFLGVPIPVRSAETLVEVIYEAHIKPGWLLQPFFQYVFYPGGGAANPLDPTGLSRIGNAAIFGLTTTLSY